MGYLPWFRGQIQSKSLMSKLSRAWLGLVSIYRVEIDHHYQVRKSIWNCGFHYQKMIQFPSCLMDRLKDIKLVLLQRDSPRRAYGIDYFQTVAPVAKLNSIRVVLSIAVNKHWPLHQLDVKNVFCNGEIQEEVFMSPGFIPQGEKEKVCRLKYIWIEAVH